MKRLFGFFFLALFSTGAFAEALTEQQKIDALLNAFDTPGITFVRNGEEHDGAWAKQHLQEKLKKAATAPTTAEGFIADIGSTSAQSGKPYEIKTADGKTVESSVWLKAKLDDLNK